MRLLIFNCGSSSLSYKVYQISGAQDVRVVLSGKAHRVGVKGDAPSFLEHRLQGQVYKDVAPLANHRQAGSLILKFLKDNLLEVEYVGHRFVHGGPYFQEAAVVTNSVLEKLKLCLPLAPIHNPASMSVILECRRVLPGVTQYVCFDSAFHSTIPAYAYTYALPRHIIEKLGFRRYGFHGLSYSYVTQETARFLNIPREKLRAVMCHLGTGGSSVAAIQNGRSVDTSMGYSPLAGLVMSTRCGDMDPMLAIYLMVTYGYSSDDLVDILNEQSGLYGLSGVSSDIRDLIPRVSGLEEEQAELAVDMYIHRLRKYVGAYALVLGGMEALVFTDDIGVGNWLIRERVCERMEWCGLVLDREANRKATRDKIGVLHAKDSKVRVLSVPTDEELSMALEGLKLLGN